MDKATMAALVKSIQEKIAQSNDARFKANELGRVEELNQAMGRVIGLGSALQEIGGVDPAMFNEILVELEVS